MTTSEFQTDNRILRGVFTFDRAFAAASALALTVASPLLADVLDWPTWVVAAIGLALAPYALFLHWVRRSGNLRSVWAKMSAVGDAGWVLGSALLLLGWPDATATAGKWLVVVAAAVVADIGLVKMFGWSRADEAAAAPSAAAIA